VADVLNTIFEYDKEDNNILRHGNYTSYSTIYNQPITILNPDLQVYSVSVPSIGSAGTSVTISWSVKNIGSGKLNTKLRKDAIYLCPSSTFDQAAAIFLGDLEYDSPLSSNQTIEFQKSVTIPPDKSGTWYVFVLTDYNSAVFEKNETNNISDGSGIQISIDDWADLKVNSFSIPDTLKTTLPYGFSCSIKNQGGLNANGEWTDGLYISKFPHWSPDSSSLVETFIHNGFVSSGSIYSINQNITLPITSDLSFGTDSSKYYFYYVIDMNNHLFEFNSDTNNVYKSDSVMVYNEWVDHIISSVTAPDSAIYGIPYNVQWTVKNIGEKMGNNYYLNWYDGIYRSIDTILDEFDVVIGINFNNALLNHNSSYNKNEFYNLPNGSSGYSYVIAYTDIYQYIQGEIVITNNFNLVRDSNGNPKLVYFQYPPPCDLSITSFTAPSSGIAGQPIDVSYTINNIGTGGALPTSWVDNVTLSDGYYPGSILLFNNTHSSGLPIDSSYTATASIYLPTTANGNYVLVFNSDVLDNVYEAGSESNNLSYSLITISQLPPCDLTASNIVLPDSVLAGEVATITWDLKNLSINPAYGYMNQALYLSNDRNWDINDALIGTDTSLINISYGAFITDTLVASLNGFDGFNYVIVKVDLLNNINESDKNNNITASDDSVYITINNLPIEVVTNDVIRNDALFNYKMFIPASLKDETSSITVTGDTLNGSTELYVSRGQIPTVAVYDYADNNPYHKTKEVVIPSIDSGTYYITISG
jgi:hypothetical protein